jgi:hypothetical protein
MNIGFSTGSIALGDFAKAVDDLNKKNGNVIELSALRESELLPLLSALPLLDLAKFEYISVHAPSKLKTFSERELIKHLLQIMKWNWPIIVHPDIIQNFKLWKALGSSLCLENMDKRKDIGRTSIDMDMLFNELPDATFCFDIAHVRQVDPTMMEGVVMAQKFRNKLVQLHVSEVNTESKHQPLTFESILAFNTLTQFIPQNIPIVLESPVTFNEIDYEMEKAKYIFDNNRLLTVLNPFKDSSIYFHNKVIGLNSSSTV